MAPISRRAFLQSAIIVSAVPMAVRHDDLTVVGCVVRPPAPMIGAWSTVGPGGEFSSAQAWADSLPMRIERDYVAVVRGADRG